MRRLVAAAAALMALSGCSGRGQVASAAGGSDRLVIGIERAHDGLSVRLQILAYGPNSLDYSGAAIDANADPEYAVELASTDGLFAPMDGQDEGLVFVDVASALEGNVDFPPMSYVSEAGRMLGMGICVRTSFGEGAGEITSSLYQISEYGLYYVGVAEMPGAEPYGVTRIDLPKGGDAR